MNNKFRINHIVLWFPLTFLFGMTALNFLNEKVFSDIMNNSFTWGGDHMAWFFQLVCLTTVLLLLIAAFSKPGRARLGGPEAKPDHSTWTWFAMILCGGMGIGIVLWGAAEPVYNLAPPPRIAGVEPFTESAAAWAMSQCFLHWGLTPYVLYTIFGLTIGIAHYNYGQPLRASSGFHFIWGEKRTEGFNSFIDMICVIALASGLAVSMGLRVLQIARGLETVAGIVPSKTIWTMIIIVIIASYTLSSYVGLDRSLKFIASYNAYIFIASLVFLIVVGPTSFMLNLGAQSLGDYVINFIPKQLWTSPLSHEAYLIWWDLFFWTVWCAYAAIMGVFLARISYGRTIKQFILGCLLAPAAFCCFWFMVYGGTTIKNQLDGAMDLWGVISDKGLEAAVFTFFSQLPLGGFMAPFFIVIVILSFVTLADPMTSAIASLSCKSEDAAYDGEPPKSLKLVWGIGVGYMALVMIPFAGFDGPRMLSTIMGVPCMIIQVFFIVSLIKGLWYPGESWLPEKYGLFLPVKEHFSRHEKQ